MGTKSNFTEDEKRYLKLVIKGEGHYSSDSTFPGFTTLIELEKRGYLTKRETNSDMVHWYFSLTSKCIEEIFP